MTITNELTSYPLASATRKYLESTEFGHVIDVKLTPSCSGETMPIIYPSRGAEIGRVAMGGAEDVALAVEAAQRTFDDGVWRDLRPAEQERRLRRLPAAFTGAGGGF